MGFEEHPNEVGGIQSCAGFVTQTAALLPARPGMPVVLYQIERDGPAGGATVQCQYIPSLIGPIGIIAAAVGLRPEYRLFRSGLRGRAVPGRWKTPARRPAFRGTDLSRRPLIMRADTGCGGMLSSPKSVATTGAIAAKKILRTVHYIAATRVKRHTGHLRCERALYIRREYFPSHNSVPGLEDTGHSR